MKYSKHVSTKQTPQSEPIPGSTQVKNSAGGYSFEVDNWAKLDRFLILGNEGGSYYAGEREMTIKNSDAALACLKEDGRRVVERVIEISEGGRAPKNDPAIFVLAMAAKLGDDFTRKFALTVLPRVCRIGTHLFQFIEAMQGFGGWGRATKRAVSSWYEDKTSDQLAYQLVKYRQRNTWSHRDVFRLAKPDVPNMLGRFAVGKLTDEDKTNSLIPAVLDAFLKAQAATSAKEIVKILKATPALPWEAIPSDFLKEKDVWAALLPNLPMTAMIRNLGRMTANGLLVPMSDASKFIVERLGNDEAIRKARIHPIAVLGAMGTYGKGSGVKGSLTWTPVNSIVDALDGAFYKAFGNVEETGKRFMLALDISSSMTWGEIGGMPGVTPRVASAAMSLITQKVEKNSFIAGFTSGTKGITELTISSRQRLDAVVKYMNGLQFGGTDCSLPMTYALENKIAIDTFTVYTDNETYAGRIHPVQALRQYREKMGIPAKLIVVGMVANNFSIADPKDAGMLDIVGFDTASPNLIADFAVR